MTPEEKQKQIDEAKAAHQKRIEELRLAVNAAGENANVRILLQHIMRLSHVFDNPSVVNTQSEMTNATFYNIGRSSLYLDLRKLMSADTKNIIERSE